MSDILAAAARRARYTGLPLDRVIKSEQARRLRQINAGQIPASLVHEAPVDKGSDGEGDPVALEAKRNATVISSPTEEVRERTPEVAAEKKRADEKSKRKAPAKKAAPVDPVNDSRNPNPVPAIKEPSAADAGDVSKVTSTDHSLPQPSAEEIVALSKKRNNIGKAVTYLDPFKKERTGKIAHVIPTNVLPSEMNIDAKGSKRRDHISYVVETDKGTMVWPNSTATDIGMKVIPSTPAA